MAIEIVGYDKSEQHLPKIMDLINSTLSEPYGIYTYRYFLNNWPELCFLAFCNTPNTLNTNTLNTPTKTFLTTAQIEAKKAYHKYIDKDKDKDFEAINTIQPCTVATESHPHLVGVVICRSEPHTNHHPNTVERRGYVAMLAVASDFQGLGLGSLLVETAVHRLGTYGCDAVVLETEVKSETSETSETTSPSETQSHPAALRLYGQLRFRRCKRLHQYYLVGSDAFRLRLDLANEP